MNIALYARASSANQKEKGRSVPDQVEAIEAWCRERGDVIVARFIDDGVSGRSIQRPGFQRLLKAAKAKKPPFDMIVTYDVSRWGRGYGAPAEREAIRANGVRVYHMSEGVGLHDTDDGLAEDIHDMQSREFSKKLARTVRRGMVSAVVRGGKGVGGPQPYGYKTVFEIMNGKPVPTTVIDPEAAPFVVLAFERYASGEAIRSVTLWLRTVSPDRKWEFASVSRMLRNPRYIGTNVIGRHQFKKNNANGKVTSIPKPKSEWTTRENAFAHIVDRELFDRVQLMLAKNKAHPRHGGHPENLIAGGIGRCTGCGGVVYFHVLTEKQGGHAHYMCRDRVLNGSKNPACHGSMRKTVFDEKLTAWIAMVVSMRDTVKNAVAEHNQHLQREIDRADVKALEKKLAEARKREERLAEGVASGGDSITVLVEHLHTAQSNRRAIEEELGKLRALHALDSQPVEEKEILQDARAIRKALLAADTETVQRLVPKIIWQIQFQFRPRPPVLTKFRKQLNSSKATLEEKKAAASAINRAHNQDRRGTSVRFVPQWGAWDIRGFDSEADGGLELRDEQGLAILGEVVAKRSARG